MDTEIGLDNIFDNLDDALRKARVLVGSPNGINPAGTPAANAPADGTP